MNQLLKVRRIAAFALLLVAAVLNLAIAEDRIADPARFEAAIAAFESADRATHLPADPTLFVGASNIRLWESVGERFKPQKVLNRGFGGAHLSDVVHFFDRVVTPYAPKVIYLNAGGNDLHAGNRPETVASHFRQFVEKTRKALPAAKLSFISIPPSPRRWNEVNQVQKANQLIAEIAAQDGKVDFVDVFPLLLDDKGQPRPEFYKEDRLHFSELGYDVVSSAIRWQKAVQQFDRVDLEQPPPENPVLFIGSSSIVRWKTLAEDSPGIPVLNRGFGGSEVFDSLTYAHRLVIPYRPKLVVFYAGGNDINRGKTPERVASDFRQFVARVHAKLPDTRIACISIAGNPARWSQVESVKAANGMLESFTKTDPRLTFINVFPKMLGDDGLPKPDIFVEDRLHMNEKGYAIWKEVVGPYLMPSKTETQEE
jgi:lysophospholipase L1-like esterase